MNESSLNVNTSNTSSLYSNTKTEINEDSTKTKWTEEEALNKLNNLKTLLNQGFINNVEYETRKTQIIDKITGTTNRDRNNKENRRNQAEEQEKKNKSSASANKNVPLIVNHPPPDFSLIEAELATKYIYSYSTNSWSTSSVEVKIDPEPFSRGSLRLVYHLQDLSNSNDSSASYVAKISLDHRDSTDKEIYFKDIEMQFLAKFYANNYNSYNPPKVVDFVSAYLLRLDEREGAPLCGVELFIPGSYRKHNNRTTIEL